MERELWAMVSPLIRGLDRHCERGRRTHSVGRIVRAYLWAVIHDRPVYWACQRRNWAGVKPPARLPDQSTMSRRLRETLFRAMLDQLIDALRGRGQAALLRCVDGKPLTVSRHSQDREATFGRGAGGMDRGYKLHVIDSANAGFLRHAVTPLDRNEHHQAAALLADPLPPGYLLGDANYDANHLYETAGRQDVILLTPRRYAKAKGLGHLRHSVHRRDAIERLAAPSPFAREMLRQRRRIESRFAHLTNFGGGLTCLPPWVRGLHRVGLWTTGKIIVRLARDRQRETSVA